MSAYTPRYDLVPNELMLAVAQVRGYHSAAYGDPNRWKGIKPAKLRTAALEHLLAYLQDQNATDETSGLPRLWHIACDVAFLLALDGKDPVPFVYAASNEDSSRKVGLNPINRRNKNMRLVRVFFEKFPTGTIEQCASFCEVSTSTVYACLRQYQLKYGKPLRNHKTKRTEKQMDIDKKMAHEIGEFFDMFPDKSKEECAEFFGVSPSTIGRHIQMHNARMIDWEKA